MVAGKRDGFERARDEETCRATQAIVPPVQELLSKLARIFFSRGGVSCGFDDFGVGSQTTPPKAVRIKPKQDLVGMERQDRETAVELRRDH